MIIIGSEADKGTKDCADTGHCSRVTYTRARESKELFIIDGKGYIDLFDGTNESVPKIVEFMAKFLCIQVFVKSTCTVDSFTRKCDAAGRSQFM